MDDYQFQHEQSPELQKQAVDAVNRTLWLEHWKLSKYSILARMLSSLGLFLMIVLPDVHTGSTIRDNVLFVFIALGVIISFIATLSHSSKAAKLKDVRPLFGVSKRIQTICACIAFAPMLLFAFGTANHRFNICFLLSLLCTAAFEIMERRNLKRHLVQWGVLEDPKTISLVGFAPVSKQLNEAEAIVDQTIGVPAKKSVKRKLFVRSKPV